jgi:hypothetical protein
LVAQVGKPPPRNQQHKFHARPKIAVATPHFSAIFSVPFAGIGKGKTALNFRVRVSVKGHNNIKINPVFRGMVRSGGFLTKGNLC